MMQGGKVKHSTGRNHWCDSCWWNLGYTYVEAILKDMCLCYLFERTAAKLVHRMVLQATRYLFHLSFQYVTTALCVVWNTLELYRETRSINLALVFLQCYCNIWRHKSFNQFISRTTVTAKKMKTKAKEN